MAKKYNDWHKMIALMLGLAACSHNQRLQGKPCKTTCGVRLYGSNDCQGFQAAEDKAVKVYDEHLKSMCDRLYGWVVYVQPPELVVNGAWAWVSPNGRVVRGLTWCRQQSIQVGTDDWSRSSLAHELLHAAECGEYMANDDPHVYWETGWQIDAIKRAQ